MVLPASSSVVGPPITATPIGELADRIRPMVLARRAVVPVLDPLAALLPDGGLVRGSTIAIAGVGATSLTLQLVAEASRDGSWITVVGVEELAPVAVLEAGIDIRRVAFIDPGTSGRHVDVLAALIGGVDVVVLDARLSVRPSETRRLASRLRERGSILILLSPGAEVSSPWSVDLSLVVTEPQWEGLGLGWGSLRSRRVRVGVSGRGRASRPSRHRLRLPASDGVGVDGEPDCDNATVVSFSR